MHHTTRWGVARCRTPNVPYNFGKTPCEPVVDPCQGPKWSIFIFNTFETVGAPEWAAMGSAWAKNSCLSISGGPGTNHFRPI